MAEFVGYVLSGLVTGGIFAVMASGLTLSYSATGLFNFAHGAIGFLIALIFYELTSGLGWPVWLAGVVSIALLAPALGWVLHVAMFRGLARAGETAQIVATIGLTIALPALGVWVVELLEEPAGLPPADETAQVRGLGPYPAESVPSLPLDTDQLVTFGFAVVVAAGLWFFMRRTPYGLRMRAAVDRRRLATLRGVNADAESAMAWMLSSTLAGLAGVLAAPVLGLASGAYMVLLFTSATAAVFGRLRSIPVTFAAGLALGVVQNLVAGYADFAEDVTGLRTAVPVLLLFAGLVWLGRSRERVAGSVATDAPPPDYLADLPRWRRALPWTAGVLALLVWSFTAADDYLLGIAVSGMVLALIFCSFVIVTGVGGMVNLAQASFAAMAALTTGWAFASGLPLAVAILLGVAGATLAGLIVALPALRLGGRVLTLATLALALLADQVLFQIDAFSNGTIGWELPALSLGFSTTNDPRTQLVLLLVLLGLVGLGIRNLERSPSGRAILAARSAPAAAQASGISAFRTKIILFVLAAAVAGLGGVLFAAFKGSITATDLPAFTGFVWLAVVVLQGVRRIGGAVLGGLIFAAFPEILANLDLSSHIAAILFGLGGVILAQHPDGVLAQFAELRYRRRRRARPRPSPKPPGDHAKVIHKAAPKAEAMFRMDGVVAGYGDVRVLRGVDLSVRSGEIVALLGANGAGKSTLCAVAACEIPVMEGRVYLGGEDVTGVPDYRRARAGLYLAPEGRGIFPSLTVDENLALTLPDRAPVYDRLPQLAARRDIPAGALSGGEQQMLALAPALVRPPKVLIADEPSLGLAPLVVQELFAVFEELRSKGVALLLVEEKATEALAIADRVAFMRLGRITWTGPRAEVDEGRLTEAYLGVS